MTHATGEDGRADFNAPSARKQSALDFKSLFPLMNRHADPVSARGVFMGKSVMMTQPLLRLSTLGSAVG